MEFETVTFRWSTQHGKCYDCGLPAVFYIGEKISDESIRCAVCSANLAADGEIVHRIKNDNL